MQRLVVNPGTAEAWEIVLQPGVISLGRSEENDYPVQHESVSSSHCQINVTPDGIWIKDLGSTAGTFIENELVEEARLKPGQTLRLGDISMQFQSDTAAEVGPMPGDSSPAPPRSPAPPLVPTRMPTARTCKFHPRAPARYACPKCGRAMCELCVNTRHEGNLSRKFCRACGTECPPLDYIVPAAPPAASFFKSLPGALVYPFTGSGFILLIAGTAFFLIMDRLPFLGLIFTGYLFSYAKRIVGSSAEGRPDPPDWPDFTNWWEDIVLPYLHLLALTLLAFGPAIVLALWHPGNAATTHMAVLAAVAFGALFAPMGMLALSMFDHVGALNPVSLAWSILRVPLPYLVAAGAFELVLLVRLLARGLLYEWFPLPILTAVLCGFLDLYFLTVAMRILGLLYATNKQRLGWFRR
jgi:FHA domain